MYGLLFPRVTSVTMAQDAGIALIDLYLQHHTKIEYDRYGRYVRQTLHISQQRQWNDANHRNNNHDDRSGNGNVFFFSRFDFSSK